MYFCGVAGVEASAGIGAWKSAWLVRSRLIWRVGWGFGPGGGRRDYAIVRAYAKGLVGHLPIVAILPVPL